MMSSRVSGQFVVATPGRSVCDDNARALELLHRLRFLALATRRGVAGVPREHTRLNPFLGFLNYVAARTSSTFRGESFRFARHPNFDRWVKAQLTPGDHMISSYGYTNECFAWIRGNGGKNFLDGGNSHPANFWTIVAEEHRLWKCALPPVAEHHYERSLAMMELVDYVLCPSQFVRESFLARGFRPEQILPNIYPVNLANFSPRLTPRPASQPFTLVNTGMLSLRKGTPYLLEAFRLIRKQVPDARLLLTNAIADSVDPIMRQFADLPIEWAPSLPHFELAARLRRADLFVLPSIEEGLARTGLEALACGVPVIVTPNTGINEFVQPGVSGTVVPIRSPEAIASAALEWWEKIRTNPEPSCSFLDPDTFGFPSFARTFLGHLQKLKIS